MTVKTVNRLTEFRRALRSVAEDVAPELTWRAGTGPSKYQEMGLDEQGFVLAGFVEEPSDDTEDLLDELLDSHGPRSIRLALESDRTLAGALDMRVAGASGVQHLRQPEGVMLGAEWQVKAMFD